MKKNIFDISIIVPVYNVERYLKRCIESILNQTIKNIELILINDGSTDKSGSICDLYKHDKRVTVIHTTNKGQSAARNLGVGVSRGDYLGFVDSDDYIHEKMYGTLYDYMKKYHADIVACNITDEGKYKSIPNDMKSQVTVFDRSQALEELPNNKLLKFSANNKLYKRGLFDNVKFKVNSIYEDLDISYRLLTNVSKVVYVNEDFYYYTYNPESTLRGRFNLKRTDEYTAKLEMFKFYQREYPKLQYNLYLEAFFAGIDLYSNIIKYFPEQKGNYQYLIQFDKNILYKTFTSVKMSLKRKMIFIAYFISPTLFFRVIKPFI